MIKQAKLIAVTVCLALCLVGFASVSFAAGGGPEHHEHPATTEHHHETAAENHMMDCPAHHDGHAMKDAQCAVACFTFMPVVGWQGIKFKVFPVPEQGRIAAEPLVYTAHIHNVPTPPPNVA